MPLVIHPKRKKRLGGLATVTAIACFGLSGVAQAATTTTSTTSTASCSAPTLTQNFLAFGDQKWYALAPGGTFSSPDGDGWQLSGGASIVSTTQYNGTTGGVLDLPSKAKA